MLKAVLIDGNGNIGMDYEIQRKIFKENDIDFLVKNCETDSEVIENCKDADIILNVYYKLTAELINYFDKCKVMVRYGIGFDAIDIDAAAKKGIPVCNIPDYCIEEVATHAIALMLSAVRKTVLYNNTLHTGEWNSGAGYDMHRLSCQTLGLVGFGNIARQTAKYAQSFGLNVVAYDPYQNVDVFINANVKKVELDELYQISDIISVHVPLTNDTHHLINKHSFMRMKKGVIIINTSRGPLICENDLIEAVNIGIVKAAGLDVVESEPINDVNHPIFRSQNIILSPHAAFNSVEATEELLKKIAYSAISVINGDIPNNVVNKKLLLKKLESMKQLR